MAKWLNVYFPSDAHKDSQILKSSLFFSTGEEAGTSSVHNVTKKIASLGQGNGKNICRDLFRFARLPIDVAYVETVVRVEPLSEETKSAKLPMWDPHEILDWLYSTGRLKVSQQEVTILAYRVILFAFIC